jgi:hypothetical protein
MDPRLLNGKPKATAIVRFDHKAILLRPGKEKKLFQTFDALLSFVHQRGFEINVAHLHPAGAWKERI